MSIKVLIADDHDVVRTGVKTLLGGTEIKIVAEASTGETAVQLALKHNPNLVLLDIRMPEGDGLSALGRIRLDRPEMPILMFSSFDNPSYVARAVALGANGYLLKSAARANHFSHSNRFHRRKYVDPRGAAPRHRRLASPRVSNDVEVPLTQRESEVLRQLALGLTNKEIAQSLQISYETVKEHVQHILRKIGVSDRTQAAVWAVRKGLV